MISRTFASVFPRQSPSSLISSSINAEADSTGTGLFMYTSNTRTYFSCAQRNLHRGPAVGPEEVREPPEHAGGRSAPRLRTIVARPAARSVGASPAAPLGGIRQHEQVQTGEQLQGEREHRQEAHPGRILHLYHGDDVDDDGHRKGNGQPAVGLPNPFVPVQCDLLWRRARSGSGTPASTT